MKKFAAISLSIVIWASSSFVAVAGPLTYTVKSGDSLWKIASQNGVTVEYLRSINSLSSDALQIGDVLKLSAGAPDAPASSAPSSPSNGIYVIQSGDCLGTIADQFSMTVEQLKALNGLQSDLIHVGSTLLVNQDAAALPVSAVQAMAAAATASPGGEQQYVLQPGDSLEKVALQFGISVGYLMQINDLQSDILDAGVVLRIWPEPVPVSRSGGPDSYMRILKTASRYLGTPYQYGGSGPGGFDCSGFVQYVFKQNGYSLPRTASSQYGMGTAVAKSNLQPGDLVFFKCYSSSIDHVGIYSGGGKFIHSSSPRSGGVIYSSLSESYYARTYYGAKRLIQ